MRRFLGLCFHFLLFGSCYELAEHAIPVRREYTVYGKRALSGLRFVLLSDFHGNPFLADRRSFFRRLKKENPDVILIPGDLISKNQLHFDRTLRFVHNLTQIAPVVASLGNHETHMRRMYPQLFARFLQDLPKERFWLLDNEELTLVLHGKNYTFYGMTFEEECFAWRSAGTLPTAHCAIRELSNPDETILLAHLPDFFPSLSHMAPVVVSGHVHGGILRLPYVGGLLSPQQLFPVYTRGCYYRNDSTLVVSVGIGSHTLPARLFNRIEYCVIHTKSRKCL